MEQRVALFEDGHCLFNRLFLGCGCRLVFKPDDIHARNFQFDIHLVPFLNQV